MQPSLHMVTRHFLCAAMGAEISNLRLSGGRVSAVPGVPPYESGRTDRGAVPPLDGPPQSHEKHTHTDARHDMGWVDPPFIMRAEHAFKHITRARKGNTD